MDDRETGVGDGGRMDVEGPEVESERDPHSLHRL